MYYLLNQSIFLELLFDFQFQYWKKSQLAEQDLAFKHLTLPNLTMDVVHLCEYIALQLKSRFKIWGNVIILRRVVIHNFLLH